MKGLGILHFRKYWCINFFNCRRRISWDAKYRHFWLIKKPALTQFTLHVSTYTWYYFRNSILWERLWRARLNFKLTLSVCFSYRETSLFKTWWVDLFERSSSSNKSAHVSNSLVTRDDKQIPKFAQNSIAIWWRLKYFK